MKLMKALLKTVFYVPLYNGLVFLLGVLPGDSAGAAVILLTLFIKVLLSPLSYRAAKFQIEMRAHEPELNRLKEKFKNDKQAQGRAVLEFYREKGVNPLAGIFPIFIQIPIVIALYYVFANGGLPAIDASLLYPFISVPDVDMDFLGIDIGGKSFILAILVGITQLFQGHLAMPPQKQRSTTPSFQEDLARGMHIQMKYVLPVFIAFVAYAASGAVALYFITSNLFTIGQELYLRKLFKKQGHLTHSATH